MTHFSEPPWTEPCTPGDDEWLARRAWFLAQPNDGWWWLSFCDPDAPKGSQFQGVCIVPGGNIVQAAKIAWDLGLNPGGEVAGYPLPFTPREDYVGVLYATREEAEALSALEPDELMLMEKS